MDSSVDFENAHNAQLPTGPENDVSLENEEWANGAASDKSSESGRYEDLFPALPGSAGKGVPEPAVPNGKTSSASWGLTGSKSVPAVRSIYKTDFFVIAPEERRHRDLPATTKFGGPTDCDQASERERTIVGKIGSLTQTSIELTPSKNDGTLSVIISGRNEQVAEAKKHLIAQLLREAQVDLPIPKDQHKHILGVKAAKLKILENETGTKILVPRHEENNEIISIRGPKEGILLAAEKIRALSDDLAKNDRVEIDVEKKYHVFISGPNNKNLESIREQTGARVRIPPLSAKEDTRIQVIGEKPHVAEAAKIISKIYQDCVSQMKETSIQIPKEQHRYILGRNGQTLQEMFGLTGVWIDVPPIESGLDSIKLIGEASKLGQALSLVYEKANSVSKIEMNVPLWIHKYLIGKKGENINRIRGNFKDVAVEFKDDIIRLEGPRDAVQSVQEQLQSEVDAILSNTKCASLRAPAEFHPHLIGKNGSNVNRLKTELNVKIHIPPASDKNPEMISIEGEPKAVEEAVRELQDAISKLQNECVKEIKCESRLHGQIIGSGGEKINELRNKYNLVNISVPSVLKKSDIITIRGDRRDVEECSKELQVFVKDLQRTNYKIEVKLFKQFVKYLLSVKGRTILQNIQKETSTKIALPKEDSVSELVTIVGEKEKVEKAKSLLEEQQRKSSDIIQKDISIPNKLHGVLLRSKRSLLNSILDEAGCSPSEVDVEFPPPGSNSDRCVISGPGNMVDKAKARLLEEVNERELASYTEELKAKPQYMKYLIGRKGANIHKLREKTSAHIIFPAEDSEDRETIVIMGKESAVKAARKELEVWIAAMENDTEASVQIPVKYHKHFVARRGEVLNRISEEFGGVKVSFPKSGSGLDVVTIKGAKDFVEGAKQSLLDQTKELESHVTIECVIPQEHHRALLGPKGSRVQGIQREFNVQVKFPERLQVAVNVSEENAQENGDSQPVEPIVDDESRNIIAITGLKERCEAAKKALEDLVPITIEVPVEAKFHRYIIGMKGRDVRELKDKYDVTVKVPQMEQNIDFVTLSGTSENVENCRVELEQRIAKIREEEEDRKLKAFTISIDIPAKYHSKIVGKRGAVVSKIRDKHDVQIKFPAKDVESDTITVSGYEQNANAARDDILALVQELEDMVTELVILDHRCHARIIGQRGRNVRKIMEDFKVEIKFPRPDAEDPNVVEVFGAADNVYEAAQHLRDKEDELMDSVQEDTQYRRPKADTFNNMIQQAVNGAVNGTGNESGERQGFVVQGAPWSQSVPDSESQSDFPSFGGNSQNGSGVTWGPRR